MMSEWRTIRAADFIDFNPRLNLKKGAITTKVAMDKLKPFTKKIPETEKAEFNGGAKFCNGDTVMARITPCLENGKTAYVDMLDDGEIGFGSTEFIVMRAKAGISNPQFVYYTAINPTFRNVAIKSMVGSSGRQRVQQSVLEELELSVPGLDEQRRIGAFLAELDEKIALNNKINDNLLEQASSIYQAWFEDFILSDGSCPPSWKQGTLAGIADITSGKRPPVKSAEKTDNAIIPIVGAASVMGYTTEANHTDKILVTGRVGTHGVVQRFNSPCWASDNTLVITSAFYEYTFQILQRIDYRTLNRGSTQPLITQGDMNKVPILIPDNETLLKFETLVGQLMKQYQVNLLENDKLAELRDALLPKLMSGEIDVSAVHF